MGGRGIFPFGNYATWLTWWHEFQCIDRFWAFHTKIDSILRSTVFNTVFIFKSLSTAGSKQFRWFCAMRPYLHRPVIRDFSQQLFWSCLNGEMAECRVGGFTLWSMRRGGFCDRSHGVLEEWTSHFTPPPLPHLSVKRSTHNTIVRCDVVCLSITFWTVSEIYSMWFYWIHWKEKISPIASYKRHVFLSEKNSITFWIYTREFIWIHWVVVDTVLKKSYMPFEFI